MKKKKKRERKTAQALAAIGNVYNKSMFKGQKTSIP